ncbi:MAG: hypothetical protein F6K40_20395 [Okeania sp. SIO3I5]|uniref:hypothetical protein n=1 Tax=Okeania sp. SIO3I5 TaxID=2607805 RepID=UPI0013B79C3C|nr:hypothetical protein [Okeania sp. SIO3I5]NEQ38498.1 hypothetical protein [Okeania sp. SIO3I5]
MLVKSLEDGCIYQEVFFGAAICVSHGNWNYYDNYQRMELETSKMFKKKFSDYFNQLGYDEAEEIPQEQPYEEPDPDGIPF